jgi:hypothetical protein
MAPVEVVVVVSILGTGPKGRGFEPGQGDEFLRAIKIRSTTSFRWEVNPDLPCRKILRLVKELLKSHGMDRLNSRFIPPSPAVPEEALVTARALWLSS